MSGARLVLGFGNRLRGDDSAGLLVADALRGRLPGATVLELGAPPADLFTRWSEDAEVVLVDAARSGAPPGTVHRFDARARPLPADVVRASTHAGGLVQAVELARALSSLPAALVVYAIEGASFEPGAPVSPAVARAAREVADALADGWRSPRA